MALPIFSKQYYLAGDIVDVLNDEQELYYKSLGYRLYSGEDISSIGALQSGGTSSGGIATIPGLADALAAKAPQNHNHALASLSDVNPGASSPGNVLVSDGASRWNGTPFAEAIRDVVATALVAGSGIAINVDDAGDTITINNSGGGGGGSGDFGDLAFLNSIGAGQINPKAVTIAKLADGLAGNLIGYGPTGEATAVALDASLGLIAGSLGVQPEAIDDRVASLIVAGTGISLLYNDAAGTLTITATGGGSGGAGSPLDEKEGLIEYPTAKYYPINPHSRWPLKITQIVGRTSDGTLDATISINGSSIGPALSASPTEGAQAFTTGNTGPAGCEYGVTLSNLNAPLDFSFVIYFEKTGAATA